MDRNFQEVLDILNDPTNYWIADGYNIILHKKTDKPIAFLDVKKSSSKFELWYITGPFYIPVFCYGIKTLFLTYSKIPCDWMHKVFNTKRWQIYSAVNRILTSDRCYFYRY